MGRKRRFLSFLIALLICCPAFAAQRTDRLDLTGGSTSAGKLDFYEDTDDGTNKTRIIPQAMAADITLTLPADDGDANSTLVNDGSGGLSWSTNPTLGTLTVNTEVYDATGWNSDLTVPTKDAVRDKIEALGGNVFQTTSNVANLVTSTDNLTIGSSTNLAKVGIDGDADEVQLLVQANATQTSNLAVFENSAGTDLLTISNTGVLTVTGSGSGSLTVGNGASSSGMIDILEDTDAGSNYARFQVPSLSANTVYTLPADDGDSGEQLQTDGSGGLSWEAKEAITAGDYLTRTTDDLDIDAEVITDTKCIFWENPVDTDDFKSLFVNDMPTTLTVTKLWCESDQTVTAMTQVDDGSAADMDSVDLVCVSTPDTDTSLDGDATIAAGDRVDMAVTSVSGTPTWVSWCFTYTKAD